MIDYLTKADKRSCRELIHIGLKREKHQYVEWKWLEKILEIHRTQSNQEGEIDTLRRLFISHHGEIRCTAQICTPPDAATFRRLDRNVCCRLAEICSRQYGA